MPRDPGAMIASSTARAVTVVIVVVVVTLATVVTAVPILAVGPVGASAPVGARPASAATIDDVRWQRQPTGEPVDDGLPIPEPTTAEADQRADDILAGPRFQEPPKSLIDRIIEWIVEQLDWIEIPGLGGAAGGSQVVGWVFIALLIGLAIFLVSRMRRSRRPRRGEPDFIVDAEVARSQHEWLSDAERFEAAGQWKQALRCRFRALVGALIERGVVRDIPGRTTGEYRVEVSRNAASIAPSFAAAADLFDRAWYGDEATGADENVRFRALADEMVLGLDIEAAADAAGADANGRERVGS